MGGARLVSLGSFKTRVKRISIEKFIVMKQLWNSGNEHGLQVLPKL